MVALHLSHWLIITALSGLSSVPDARDTTTGNHCLIDSITTGRIIFKRPPILLFWARGRISHLGHEHSKVSCWFHGSGKKMSHCSPSSALIRMVKVGIVSGHQRSLNLFNKYVCSILAARYVYIGYQPLISNKLFVYYFAILAASSSCGIGITATDDDDQLIIEISILGTGFWEIDCRRIVRHGEQQHRLRTELPNGITVQFKLVAARALAKPRDVCHIVGINTCMQKL